MSELAKVFPVPVVSRAGRRRAPGLYLWAIITTLHGGDTKKPGQFDATPAFRVARRPALQACRIMANPACRRKFQPRPGFSLAIDMVGRRTGWRG
jgi:hypothetical protein